MDASVGEDVVDDEAEVVDEGSGASVEEDDEVDVVEDETMATCLSPLYSSSPSSS